MKLLTAIFIIIITAGAVCAEEMVFVTVGSANNAADTYAVEGVNCGEVDHVFQISKYEVTNAQYTEFLNAVAKTDAYGLYNINMGDANYPNRGGIRRSGSNGNYTYAATSGRENKPVNWVNWRSAARFANWMHNGKKADAASTESGAYNAATFSGSGANHSDQVLHNSNAKYWIPTRNEWYKAAFYKGGSTNAGYWIYAGKSNAAAQPGPFNTTANRANYEGDNFPQYFPDGKADLLDVGFYTLTPGPFGTFDMGGNVAEWFEDWWPGLAGYYRTFGGGAWKLNSAVEVSRDGVHVMVPENSDRNVGFRLAKAVEKRRKKLFQWGYGDPDTSHFPMLINQMKQQPLDGTLFRARPVNGTSMGEFNWKAWGTTLYTKAQMQHCVDEMRATNFGRFSETFLRLNATPGTVDWFDDYSTILANCGTAAWIVKQGGAKGIMFDNEAYEGHIWDYNARKYSEKSYAEYCAQVRLRGKHVIEAMQAEHPDLIVFITVSYSYIWKMLERDGMTLTASDHSLLPAFIDGMLDGAGPDVRLIDAYEWAYNNRNLAEFEEERKVFETDCLPIVANPNLYRQKFELAFPIWLDYGNRTGGWHYNPSEFYLNYYTPEQFNSTLRAAMQVSDEYVWIYNEWLFWWDAYGYRDIPVAYENAVRSVWVGGCGDVIDRGTILIGDINKDCYVNFKDMSELIQNWVKCNNPHEAGCIATW